MPPKKKVKEPQISQEVSPEPQQPNLFKIPKRPFYRSVYLDSDERAKHIQIKLWKINSLKAQLLARDTKQNPSSLLDSHKNLSRALTQLSNRQRAFKNLRRFHFSFDRANESNVSGLILRSWKLEKLLFHCYGWSFSMKKLVSTSLNPHLKDFFQMGHFDKERERSIDGWRYLVNCNFWLQHSLVINTKKNRSFAKERKGFNKNQVTENIEATFQHIPSLRGLDIFDLPSMNASQLPNLKAARISYSVFDQKDQSNTDLDFIKSYPHLSFLFISAQYQDVPSLEFLSSLIDLKQFTYSSAQDPTRKIQKTLPLIHSLEKLRIVCHPAEFSSENLQEFLSNNKDLKHLEVQIPLQDDYIILHEKLLLPIETLKIFITDTEKPLKAATVKKLASFLNKHQHLKSLHVHLGPHLSLEHCDILLKGMTSMTCLERLTWSWGTGGNEIQESKLGSLKKILTQSPGIQELELNFVAVLTAKDFSNILDGLVHLKKLKNLFLSGTFLKISPAAFSKFLQVLHSLVFENAAIITLDLEGIAQEMMEEINKVIEKKYDLYGDKNISESFNTKFDPDWW